MEMCIDNPREGFADLFATHPSVDSRIAALIKFAGGHDPGRLPLADATHGHAPASAVAQPRTQRWRDAATSAADRGFSQ
jgi:heat shock protein HtpX